MLRTHVQESLPTKNLQHPQNTLDQVNHQQTWHGETVSRMWGGMGEHCGWGGRGCGSWPSPWSSTAAPGTGNSTRARRESVSRLWGGLGERCGGGGRGKAVGVRGRGTFRVFGFLFRVWWFRGFKGLSVSGRTLASHVVWSRKALRASLCCDRSYYRSVPTVLFSLFSVTYNEYCDQFPFNLCVVFVPSVLFSCTFRAVPTSVQPPNCHPRLSAAAERCPRRVRRSTRVNRCEIDLASHCGSIGCRVLGFQFLFWFSRTILEWESGLNRVRMKVKGI